MHQSKLIRISLGLPRLMRLANSAGIAVWGMFLVRTRDFTRLTTTTVRRFRSNMFEHRFRNLRLVYIRQALRDLGLPHALNPRSKRVTVSFIRRQIFEEKECDADHAKGLNSGPTSNEVLWNDPRASRDYVMIVLQTRRSGTDGVMH